MIEEEDESLMEAIQRGSHQAFAILVRRHTDRFFKSAYYLCGANKEMAEDLVQDAFLKIWNNPMLWQTGRGAKFTTWFHRILVNQTIDESRRKKAIAVDSDILNAVSDVRDNQEDVLTRTEEQERIEKAIKSLPERQRTALNLCFYDGVTNADAAKIMGVTVKALESLLMRGKVTLKDALLRKENGGRKDGYYGT